MGLKMLVPVLILSLILGVSAFDPLEILSSDVEQFETNLDDPKYRLKNNIKTKTQSVDLDVYLDESRFNGLTQIEIEIEAENLKQIVLHQKVVEISSVTVLSDGNKVQPLQTPNPFETDDYYEILKINLAQPIPAGNCTLVINYKGKINENALDRGFYRGHYFVNNTMLYYAVSHFQPYHARKAFPCFDEPQFKARFTISITRPSDFSRSYSNMNIRNTMTVSEGRVRETFDTTPEVSSYLVTFLVSRFVETQANSPTEPFGIISRPGPVDQHKYALDIGQKITNWMNQEFDINYYDMGQGEKMKNDHMALPDFPAGAMENWGMVNYRESNLLFDEKHTSLPGKLRTATIVAHELAHKWFGNLVTCFWWSNLWLNEAFAAFYQYFGAHGADGTLELDDQFVTTAVHSALANDANAGANPMNWTGAVDNPSVSAHFGVSSYAKAASVLRMMEHLVTPATFRKALRYYLKDNAYKLGTPEKMYTAFRRAVREDNTLSQLPGVDIGDVFDSWVQNPGAPVVKVDVDYATGAISVSQQRYQLSGVRPSTLWKIPLTYTRANNIDFENLRPSVILSGYNMTLPKPAGNEWVLFNTARSGLYRVNYDDFSWELIAEGLRTSRETIHKLSRAQIVNDVLFFIRSGDISIARAFDVLSFLKDETDYYVWNAAMGQLDWLRRRTKHIDNLYQEFNGYLLEQMNSVIETLGYDEGENDSVSTILNRIQILSYACNMGHEGCVTDAVTKWNAFRQNTDNLVPPNLRAHVYCVGLREGNRADYDFLWQRYNTSENAVDMVLMLGALPCTRDQTAVHHYLEQSLYSGTIRLHDKPTAFSNALAGNPENLQTVLNFVFTRYEDIRVHYGGTARLVMGLNSIAAYLTDFSDIIKFQTWAYENQLSLTPEEFASSRSVVNSAVNNLNWASRNAVDLHTALVTRNASSSLFAPVTMVLAALILHLFY
uniref:Aminopeptidase n=1 Tax=Plutella xylostella TaxID=51655 RepID=A0A6G5NKR6_PLUXY|nr:aminopeptidase N4b [Plutella xylostella]